MRCAGGVSSGLLMAGPAAAIAGGARRRILELGREGGCFCAPDQGLPYPRAHLEALGEAIERYGRYPLATS